MAVDQFLTYPAAQDLLALFACPDLDQEEQTGRPFLTFIFRLELALCVSRTRPHLSRRRASHPSSLLGEGGCCEPETNATCVRVGKTGVLLQLLHAFFRPFTP